MNPALLALLGARVSAGAWTPASVAGTAMWFDATDGATITHVGGAVSQWSDKGSKGLHMTQAVVAYRPTTGTTTQNSLNVMAFDGGDYLTNATLAELRFLHDGTKHVVGFVAQKATTANRGLYSTRYDDGPNGEWMYLTGSNVSHVITSGSGATVNNTAAGRVSPPAPIVGTLLVDPTNATAADRSAIFIGDSTVVKASTQTAASGSSNGSAFVLGSLKQVSAYNLVGWIGELVIIAGTDATESNRAALHTYLKTKWGL